MKSPWGPFVSTGYKFAWGCPCGRSSAVERLPSKQDVTGSNPVARSSEVWLGQVGGCVKVFLRL